MQNAFQDELQLTPVVGGELEFYLSTNIDKQILSDKTRLNIITEKGQNQFEINIPHSSNLVAAAKEIANIRSGIINTSIDLGGFADFSSKPFQNDYGSSMHIHINFIQEYDIEKCAQILCNTLDQHIDSCLPTAQDYERLDAKFMAPTHIAWGGNNRTMLIRIPDSKPIRLEHRLPAANSDPAIVLYSILSSLKEGLLTRNNNTCYLPKIYGNAFDKQYNLVRIYKKKRCNLMRYFQKNNIKGVERYS